METRTIKGSAKFGGNHYKSMNPFVFVIETDDAFTPVITTSKTKCDMILAENDEYFFEIIKINGKDVVVSIKEVFDYKKGLINILENSLYSQENTEDTLENSLNYIERKIFSLEVKERYEEYLLIYDTIEGELQEIEDELFIVFDDTTTVKAIIDTSLTINEKDFSEYRVAKVFEGIYTPDGFYIRKCFK